MCCQIKLMYAQVLAPEKRIHQIDLFYKEILIKHIYFIPIKAKTADFKETAFTYCEDTHPLNE